MNTTTRRLASIVMVMFLALLVSTTWIQFFQAESLNNDPRNARALYEQFGTDRGPIVVGGEAIASSVPVDDEWNYQREYAHGRLYAPLTGFYSLVSGTTGIERAENDFLAGSADALWVDRLQNLLTGTDAQGSSVELTIDPDVQKVAWDALGDRKGAVVAIEPSTGRIIALVSKPSFDPNDLATHDTGAANDAYAQLLNDDDDPLNSKATDQIYPPGSTFKLVTAAAALESGDYDADTVVAAPDTYTPPGTNQTIGNYGGTSCSSSGKQTLAEAMQISCNTAFAELGVELGDEALFDQAEKFGFGTSFSVPFSTEASVFPEPPIDPAFVAQSAIGQWNVRETPLQVAMISAAIANGGEVMEPYSVDRIRNPELEVVQETRPNSLGDAVSEDTANQLTDMMVSVVEGGSGSTAAIDGVQVAGKTGTAQTGVEGESPHTWFTGFAPADDPQVAVAVFVEHGGATGTTEVTGGRVSAPIAKEVMEAVLNG